MSETKATAQTLYTLNSAESNVLYNIVSETRLNLYDQTDSFLIPFINVFLTLENTYDKLHIYHFTAFFELNLGIIL